MEGPDHVHTFPTEDLCRVISRQHAPARVELVLRDQDFRKALRFADISVPAYP